MAKEWKVEDADGKKGVTFHGGPCFIVRKEIAPGEFTYFLTVGVLEYDGVKAAGHAQKEKGVAEIECLFGKAKGTKLKVRQLNSDGTLPKKCVQEGGMAMAAGADAGRLGEAAASAPQGGQGGGGSKPPHPPHPPPGPGPAPPPAPPPEEPPGVQTEPPGVQTGP